MVKKYSTKPGDCVTPEQLKEVEEAAKQPINFDDDCKELSPAMVNAFRTAVSKRNSVVKA
ncbi:MAG TPA: hypothetical protein DCP07_06825 [Lachnospiraceae bacterium]|nr:hypothetical protein [Lachnospiraceae bacterium]